MERPRISRSLNLKLVKIHLRHHPPSISFLYMDPHSKLKEKVVDLFDLDSSTNTRHLANEIIDAEPMLSTTPKRRVKLIQCLEKLKKAQCHDFTKKYLQFQCIRGHSLPMTGAAFSRDGERCATCCLGNAAKVWSVQSGREIAVLTGHEDSVTSIHFNYTGDELLTSSHDGTLRHWRIADNISVSCTGVLQTSDKGNAHGGVRVLFGKYSPDQLMAVSATDDKKACVHDLAQGVLCYKFSPKVSSQEEITSLNMDGTGTILLASPHDTCSAAIFDLRSGEISQILEGHEAEVTKSIFDFRGQFVATGSWDHTVKLWDLRRVQQAVQNFNGASEILDIEFDLCGNKLVAGSSDGILLMDAHDGTLIFEHTRLGPTRKVGFSPNGALILGASEKGVISLFQSETGTLLQNMPDHTREILEATFSYNSDFLMTASKDKTVRIHKHTNTTLIGD